MTGREGAPSSCSSVVTIVAKFGQCVSGSSEKNLASRASMRSVSGQRLEDRAGDRLRIRAGRQRLGRHVLSVRPRCQVPRHGRSAGMDMRPVASRYSSSRRRPMANLVVHFEIHASEPQKLIDFYSALLGWRFNSLRRDPVLGDRYGRGRDRQRGRDGRARHQRRPGRSDRARRRRSVRASTAATSSSESTTWTD